MNQHRKTLPRFLLCISLILISEKSICEGVSPLLEKALTQNKSYTTREAIVEINGSKYRKIEFDSNTYYLKLLQPSSTADEYQVICGQNDKRLEDAPRLVSGSIKTTRRTRLFIEGLKETCVEADGTGRKKITINPDLRIGFSLDDDSNGSLKQKQIYYTPLGNSVGFSSQF